MPNRFAYRTEKNRVMALGFGIRNPPFSQFSSGETPLRKSLKVDENPGDWWGIRWGKRIDDSEKQG